MSAQMEANLAEVENEQQDILNEGKGKTDIQRFLTFVTDGLTFGVNSNQVVEIITNHKVRAIPMVPDYVTGVINLRGQVIPIIDMRLRLGKMFQEYTPQTCTIILEIDSNPIGITVDSVSQVLDIDLLKASPIPVENRQELTNNMISIDDGTVVLILECQELMGNIGDSMMM